MDMHVKIFCFDYVLSLYSSTMAHLNRLIIQGIRSFGPDDGDTQNIKFSSPLTLILGQNGCGKTTIIESLKYAVSGDLPPGAKQGQLFVHDPKISRKVEVSHCVLCVLFFILNSTPTSVQNCVDLTARKVLHDYNNVF
jgi:DNA repair protein RAD50